MKFFVEWVLPSIGVAAIAICCLVLAGAMMDQNARYHAEYHKCLERAHTGLEIEECR